MSFLQQSLKALGAGVLTSALLIGLGSLAGLASPLRDLGFWLVILSPFGAGAVAGYLARKGYGAVTGGVACMLPIIVVGVLDGLIGPSPEWYEDSNIYCPMAAIFGLYGAFGGLAGALRRESELDDEEEE